MNNRLLSVHRSLLALSALAIASCAIAGSVYDPTVARYWHKNVAGVPGDAADGDQYGHALAVGDYNCDGYDDLAAGIPFHDKTGGPFTLPDAGAVNVLYGGPGGLSEEGSQLLVSPKGGGGEFGFALAAIPVDGFPACNDLWVGAPGLESDKGRVFHYKATLSGLLLDSGEGVSAESFGFTGGPGHRFGHAIAAGSVRADGKWAYAISAPFGNVFGTSEAGMVIAVLTCPCFPDHILFIDEDTPGMAGIAEAGDRFGWSLAFSDDNGDGYEDLVVGSPFEDVGMLTDAGAVSVVYYGDTSVAIDSTQFMAAAFPGPGSTSQQFFGHTLAARPPGSDQVRQIAIGAVGTYDSLPGAGAVFLRSVVASVGGNASYAYGLLDGDDFGVAQTFDQVGHGIAYLLRGTPVSYTDWLLVGIPGEGGDIGSVGIKPSNFGTTQGYPTLDQTSILGFGNEFGDRFGQVLAAGNFNGEGFDELIVGVPTEDVSFGAPTAVDAGTVIELTWDANYEAPLFADSFEGAPL